jgi:hypothetical protein
MICLRRFMGISGASVQMAAARTAYLHVVETGSEFERRARGRGEYTASRPVSAVNSRTPARARHSAASDRPSSGSYIDGRPHPGFKSIEFISWERGLRFDRPRPDRPNTSVIGWLPLRPLWSGLLADSRDPSRGHPRLQAHGQSHGYLCPAG